MARRSKEDAWKTRTRILASALALFTKKGYGHTTFTDIASRLKMTKGAVYWHFPSKQALLMALVDEMLDTFQKEIDVLPAEGTTGYEALSFPAVADIMVRQAIQTVADARKTSFFLLMHEQIKWASAEMDEVRENLLKDKRRGPWEAFRAAVENDRRAGRVRADTDAVQVASCCIALWNGLVRARIAHFLQCDLEQALRQAFRAMWQDLSMPRETGRLDGID